MNKADFPILKQTIYNKPLVYLDNAATTQKPQQVIDAISYAYSTFNANIHRGVHYLSQLATTEHESARKHVAQYIGAQSEREIIFTKGTTDSINMLAWSLGEWQKEGRFFIQPGDQIIVSTLDHHSNIVPWQMLAERRKAVLKVIPLLDNQSLDIEAFKALLNERTRIVSVAHVSNVLGIINPVKKMAQMAHAVGALFSLDAAQSMPHMQVDVRDIDCDFCSFSAHKMYGPTGIGILYGKENLLDVLPPAEGGGEMIEHVRFEQTTYNTLPYKFEAGTPNFIGSYAFGKALDYIEQLGKDAIFAEEKALTQALEKALSEADYNGCKITIYGANLPKAGAVSFNLYNPAGKLIHPYDIGMLLNRQGVAVRTGHHCAEPLIDYLHIPGTVRASIALYNDADDIHSLIRALQVAASMLA